MLFNSAMNNDVTLLLYDVLVMVVSSTLWYSIAVEGGKKEREQVVCELYNIYIFPGRPFVQFVMSDVGHVYITTPPHPAPDDCLLAEEKLVLIFYPNIH